MSRYPLPSDDRLEQLIRESFEHMPGPQMVRLDQIEQRLKPALSRQNTDSKVNKTPWWVVLLLTGGIAMAAWWTVESFLPSSNMDAQTGTNDNYIYDSDATIDTEDSPADNGEAAPEQESDYGRESPIIYQRESL